MTMQVTGVEQCTYSLIEKLTCIGGVRDCRCFPSFMIVTPIAAVQMTRRHVHIGTAADVPAHRLAQEILNRAPWMLPRRSYTWL